MSSSGGFLNLDESVPPINGLAAAVLGASQVAAFENLYLAYGAEARNLARAILDDAELAADAVHNGFLEMLRYLLSGRRWHDPADARAMVLRNVRWAALNLHRARRRLAGGLDATLVNPGDEASWARAEARAVCEEIVGRLSAAHRTAIGLRYGVGLSNIEAAERLGVSVDVFEGRLQRALRAARRSARATGLVPGMAAFLGAARRAVKRRPRMGREVRGSVVTVASMAASLTVAAFASSGWDQPGAGELGSNPEALPAVAARAAVLDLIDTATIVDAVGLPSGVVLAIGRGQVCTCWAVYRSLDGGATWESAPGPQEPSQRPRALGVPAGYPADSRIVTELAAGGAMEVSPRFGAPFAAATGAPALLGGARHPQLCGSVAAPRFCRSVGGVVARFVAGSYPGTLLTLFDGRLAYFPPFGGVLCSVDRGLEWRPRCPPAAP